MTAPGVWEQTVGQPEAVTTLSRAVADPDAMTHAWLLTGPPGSGRSVAARSFAAALQCPEGGCGSCLECRTAMDGTHADVSLVATSGLSIGVEQARELVRLGSTLPSVGRYRVIVIEDTGSSMTLSSALAACSVRRSASSITMTR